MSSVATEVLEKPGDFVFAKLLSIVLIGPDELRRKDVAGVLAEYPGIQVREFSSYPTDVRTVSRLLARQFDIVAVDLDSDSKAALDLVESFRGETTVTVIVYTEEADPESMSRCMRAGAREHLVLPVRESALDKVLARARIGLSSEAQPATKPAQLAPMSEPERQVIAIPLTSVEPEPQAVATSAIPNADVLREKMLPVYARVQREDEILRPVTRTASDAQPAPKPEPQVIATPRMDLKPEPQIIAAPRQAIASPETDVLRDKPSPVSAPAHIDEDLRPVSGSVPVPRDNSAVQDRQQAAASPERVTARVTARAFDDVSPSPRRTAGVVVEEMRYVPEATPLAPVKEDSLEKLRAVAAAYNAGQATASQRITAPRAITEVSAAPVISNGAVKPRDIVEPVKKIPVITTIKTDDGPGVLSFHSDLDELGDEDDEDANRKKWVRVGVVGFVILVLLLFIGPRLLNPPKHTLAAQSGQVRPVAEVLDAGTKAAKPSPSTFDEGHPSSTAHTYQTSIAQPATSVEEAILPKTDSRTAAGAKSGSSQVDSTLMNGQLTSAPRIPQDVKTPRKEEAPPSTEFAAANNGEMGSGTGAAGSVFSGQTRPSIRFVPPPPVVIPVEVAEKLLIYKKLPTYPPHAWNNYISGKVVVDAVVSETGTVESLKIVSGPKQFQQAALDAVKTWRYKPYVVNDRPAKIQTTATLIFDPRK